LGGIEQYLDEFNALCPLDTPSAATASLAIMATDNVRTLTFGMSLPIEILQSPFQGKRVEETHTWFNANVDRFSTHLVIQTVFIILDTRTIEDGTCLLVSALDDAKSPKSLRSDSYMALAAAMNTLIGNDTFEGDVYGDYARGGFVLTERNRAHQAAAHDLV